MMRVSQLGVSLKGRDVARDISFSVSAGEIVSLIGPNGAGKSSLMKALAGVLPARGEILFGGVPANSLSRQERARHFAWLPQSRPVAWNLKAQDVVALGRFAGSAAPYDRMGDADREAVATALCKADVTHLAERSFQTLSGGEQARLHFARLLASPAPLLLLDEPCAALDIAHQLSLMETLQGEAASGRGILVILHDLDLASRFSSRILIMEEGQLIADASSSEALSPERMARIFGVRRNETGQLERVIPA